MVCEAWYTCANGHIIHLVGERAPSVHEARCSECGARERLTWMLDCFHHTPKGRAEAEAFNRELREQFRDSLIFGTGVARHPLSKFLGNDDKPH